MHKQQAAIGNKYLKKIAKSLFNVSTTGRVAKGAPEAHRAQGVRLKAELSKMEKRLKEAILGSDALVSSKECEALIASSTSWHKRTIVLMTAAAMKF